MAAVLDMSEDHREEDFQYFLSSFQQATALIESDYFQLPVLGQENPIYRERVYCYELYHRLRSTLKDSFKYKLDGELDKSGHPILHETVGPVKPDFLVHERGAMNKNLIVIEVKPINVILVGLSKDLKTLQNFLNKAEYYRAIYLIYGNGPRSIEKVVSQISNIIDNNNNRFYLLSHSQPLTPAEIVLRN